MKTAEQHPQIAMGVHINQLLFSGIQSECISVDVLFSAMTRLKCLAILSAWIGENTTLCYEFPFFYWGAKVTKHLQQRLFRSHLPRELEAEACGHQVWLRTQLTSNVGQGGGWGWVWNQQQKRWVSLVYTCLFIYVYIYIYACIFIYVSISL